LVSLSFSPSIAKPLLSFFFFFFFFSLSLFYLEIINLPKMDLFDQCWGNNDNRSYQVRGENDVRGIVGLMGL
jgi:hypothetical protein